MVEIEVNHIDLDAHEHLHGTARRPWTHVHAWSNHPHSHLLRGICSQPECKGFEQHDVHQSPDRGR